MASYIENVLLPTEQVAYVGQLHWVIFIPGLISAIGGALLCIVSPDFLNQGFGLGILGSVHGYLLTMGVAAVLGGVGMLLHAYMRLISTELAVTNRRVIAKTGFISRNTFELMLSRVEGANIDQTVLGRLLGFGTIFVHGTGGGITPIDHVSSPMTFKKQLMLQMDSAQRGPSAAAAN